MITCGTAHQQRIYNSFLSYDCQSWKTTYVIRGIRHNWNQVARNDGQIVPVNGKAEVGVRPRVDDAHQVAFSCLEMPLRPGTVSDAVGVIGTCAVELVFTVD